MSAEQVTAIFTDAGWQPSTKDGWKGSFTWSDGVVVGGIDPWGTMRATSNAAHGMTLEEAAAWLVEHARQRAPVVLTTEATLDPLASLPEEQQSQGHEGDGETGAEAITEETLWGDSGGSPDLHAGRVDEGPGGGVAEGGLAVSGVDFGEDEPAGEDAYAPLDADFTEDPLLEFGGEVLEEHPEEAPPPQDRFYGLDDLDRRRSLRIGDVVRISHARQYEIELLMGDNDFAAIQSAVVRDMVDGIYRGRQDVYDLFVELSRHQSAINRVKSAEAAKVAFLKSATREEIDGFNPEADWQ